MSALPKASAASLLSPDAQARIAREVRKFPADQKQSAVMAALAIAQDEHGWVSPEVIEAVAKASPFTKSYLIEAHPVALVKNVFTIGFDPEFGDHLGLVDNSKTRTLRTEIDLPNEGARFLPGMYAYGYVTIRREKVTAIPARAIAKRGDIFAVFMLKDGKAVQAEARLGPTDGDWTELDSLTVGGNPVALAIKQANLALPVVFSVGGDPVQMNLVKTLNRPEGNLTGITLLASELDVKRLELLREMVPKARKVALFTNSTNPAAVNEQKAMEAAGGTLDMQLETIDIKSTSDIDRAFDKLPPGRVDALAVVGDAFMISRRDKIVGLAAQRRLPAIYPAREFADNGGLMSYGTRWADMYVIVGTYAGRLLKGAKPADLPVQRPNRYELVINLRTAKALGLIPSPVLLGRADEVLD